MKANELMIGDWVRVTDACIGKSTPCKITSIWENEYVALDGDIDAADLPTNLLEPIHLTSKILEKNGFTYNDSPFVQGWEQYGLTLTAGGDGFRVSCGQNASMTIDSAHQLQHALRLCGINKQIEL